MGSDHRKHRGAHPDDGVLFSGKQQQILRDALKDFAWLLDRNYPLFASLKLTGDHFNLTKRQRILLMRCACTEQQITLRAEKCQKLRDCQNTPLLIDGFNLLITLESALSGVRRHY